MKNLVKALFLVFLVSVMIPQASGAECISVNKAQTILKELNYFPDAVDGVLGTATMKSLRTFQADYEIGITGNLDKATCDALMAEEERLVKERLHQKQELMVKRSQAKLRELGYYTGPVSGKLSDIPGDAITDFQKEHGLNQTARLDGGTLKVLFSDSAHEKPVVVIPAKPAVPQAPALKKPEPPAPVKASTRKASKPPLWIWSVGPMTYKPKSLYDSTDHKATVETNNPDQAVTYKSESYLINQLTLNLNDFQFNLATSRLGGGDYAADSLGLVWAFEMLKKPMLFSFDYSAIESEAFYGSQDHDITTDSLDSELLFRHKPGFKWGLNLTYETYPTLVSVESKSIVNRSILFDENFTLSTVNGVLKYDTVAAGKTGLFGSDRFFPYVTMGLYGGISYGKVSDSVIDALSTDLSHSFSATIYNLNLRVTPELGVKYIWKRRNYDLELTLGYGVDIRWPTWELLKDSEDEVKFYRRDLSHGLIFGLNAVF